MGESRGGKGPRSTWLAEPGAKRVGGSRAARQHLPRTCRIGGGGGGDSSSSPQSRNHRCCAALTERIRSNMSLGWGGGVGGGGGGGGEKKARWNEEGVLPAKCITAAPQQWVKRFPTYFCCLCAQYEQDELIVSLMFCTTFFFYVVFVQGRIVTIWRTRREEKRLWQRASDQKHRSCRVSPNEALRLLILIDWMRNLPEELWKATTAAAAAAEAVDRRLTGICLTFRTLRGWRPTFSHLIRQFLCLKKK